MTTWQPPIPAGALYSKPARQLGPALALLAYCYDLVQRDGWFDLVLKDASGDMEVDYRTMRRWWHEVSSGPFFCEIVSRSKLGYRVRFKDGWIDWRVLNARQPKEFTPPDEQDTDELPLAPDKRADMSSQDDKRQLSATLAPDKRADMSSNQNVYKEDHHDQKTGDPSRKKLRDPPSDHQRLLAAYQEALGYKIPNGGKEAAAAKKILAAGYSVEQAVDTYLALKMRDFYSRQHLSLQTVYEQIGATLTSSKGQTNGTLRPTTHNGRHPDPRTEWAGFTETDLDKPL